MRMKVCSHPKLALIVPTCNRPECIHYFLERRLPDFVSCGVDLILLDGSSGNRTKKIAEMFQNNGAGRLIYRRYVTHYADTLDEKVFFASRLFCGDYDYLWFCSDGTVPDIQKITEAVFPLMMQGKMLIVLEQSDQLSAEICRFRDSALLLRECGWCMSRMNAVIVPQHLIAQAVSQYPVSVNHPFWLWHPFVYFHIFADGYCNAARYKDAKLYEENPFRQDSFWKLEGNALWQWAFVWPKVIRSLPECYDEVKEEVIQLHDAHTGIFSIKSLFSMREYDCITLKKVWQYRKNIPEVTKTGIVWFYLAALTNKYLIRGMKILYHRIGKKWRK